MAGGDQAGELQRDPRKAIIPLKMNFVAAGQDFYEPGKPGLYPGFVPHIYNQTFDGTTKVEQTLASRVHRLFLSTVLGGDSGQNGDVLTTRRPVQPITKQLREARQRRRPADGDAGRPIDQGHRIRQPHAQSGARPTGSRPTSSSPVSRKARGFQPRLQSLMGSALQIDSTTVPIFPAMADNVLLYEGTRRQVPELLHPRVPRCWHAHRSRRVRQGSGRTASANLHVLAAIITSRSTYTDSFPTTS